MDKRTLCTISECCEGESIAWLGLFPTVDAAKAAIAESIRKAWGDETDEDTGESVAESEIALLVWETEEHPDGLGTWHRAQSTDVQYEVCEHTVDAC